MTTLSDLTKVQLENGLTVLLKEVKTAPIVSFWMWYRVGSRNEPTGKTGASHWVEHMQFKGTEAFPGDAVEKMVSRTGGNWNAMTSFDWTTYYETLPADQVRLALEIEADRMVNSLYEPEEVESERTVIISERQGSENEPMFLLDEEVTAAAFRVHPYHHEVLGDQIDVETMTRDDLYGHYQTYYAPNNAIAVLVGDFDSDDVLAQIKEIYGSIPAQDTPRPFVRPEPPQRGERRVMLEGDGESSYMVVSYHGPDSRDPDFFPMLVLTSALTGAKSMGSGGTSNRTSRLYKALVLNELAAFMGGSFFATIDPYLYSISVMSRPGVALSEIEAALDAEIARLADEPLTDYEFEKVMKQSKAAFAFSAESASNLGFWYGYAEILDDYTWFTDYLTKLEQVTIADVQRVAQKYLVNSNRVVGHYVPKAALEVA